MKQEAKAHIPGIDLTFPDGKTGWIWGISGVDDLRGTTFEKASIYLRDRAQQEGAFDWTIIVELESIGSPAFRSLLRMMMVLNELILEKPDRRSVTIEWVIKPGEESMHSMAEQMQSQIKNLGTGGLLIKIVDQPPAKSKRR
ncbi:MAG: hypothetical protein QOD09_5083 [Bradyrhizobium sp.]|jgi:hypothetical protein|nr:hypothetical protein [Bradyrhizobium sp.]